MIGMESHLQMDVVLLLNNLEVRRGLKNNEKESIRSTYGRFGEYGIDYNGYDIDKIENVKLIFESIKLNIQMRSKMRHC